MACSTVSLSSPVTDLEFFISMPPRGPNACWPGERNAWEPTGGEERWRELQRRLLRLGRLHIPIRSPPERVVSSAVSRNGRSSTGAVRLFAFMWHTLDEFIINDRSAQSAGTQNPPYRMPARINLYRHRRARPSFEEEQDGMIYSWHVLCRMLMSSFRLRKRRACEVSGGSGAVSSRTNCRSIQR